MWRQLEFSPSSDEAELPKAGDEEGRNEDGDEEGEPRDLDTYGKVFEAERVEWVRSDGFGCIGMCWEVLFCLAGWLLASYPVSMLLLLNLMFYFRSPLLSFTFFRPLPHSHPCWVCLPPDNIANYTQ